MMKAGTETGSLMNHIYSNVANAPTPEVGMGVTMLHWTDRHAGTIVKITKTQIHVQRDIPTRVDGNGMSDAQAYTYQPNPDAPVEIFRMTRKGYRCGSTGLLIGLRKEYYDYSF